MNVISWSGGKDSTATIILAHIHNIPIDKIIFSEVMFDETTSGELPEHIEFVHKAIKVFNNWGYNVEILHDKLTYMDCFNTINKGQRNPERKGMIYGFPMAGRCIINDRCKMRPIRLFNKQHPDAIHFVGIATDEPRRLARLKDNDISLLYKYGYSEQDAYNLCKEYDLLSPCYSYSKRGGCWFCPNARDEELKYLRDNYPDLWSKLLELELVDNKVGYCWNTLTKTSILDKEEQFRKESI